MKGGLPGDPWANYQGTRSWSAFSPPGAASAVHGYGVGYAGASSSSSTGEGRGFGRGGGRGEGGIVRPSVNYEEKLADRRYDAESKQRRAEERARRAAAARQHRGTLLNSEELTRILDPEVGGAVAPAPAAAATGAGAVAPAPAAPGLAPPVVSQDAAHLTHDGFIHEPVEEPTQHKTRLKLDACIAEPARATKVSEPCGPERHNDKPKPTTLTLCNIPECYSQRDLALELETLGFNGFFDYIYLPRDDDGRNVGYGFVNFIVSAAADLCMKMVTGYVFRRATSAMPARVSVARVQGLAENLCSFNRINAHRRDSHRPLVIPKGVRTTAMQWGRSAVEMACLPRSPASASACGAQRPSSKSTIVESANNSSKILKTCPRAVQYSSWHGRRKAPLRR